MDHKHFNEIADAGNPILAAHMTRTENGMPAYKSSNNPMVDLFYSHQREDSLVAAHFNEPVMTGQLLLWMRDARGGAGERRAFREQVRRYLYMVAKDEELRSSTKEKVITNFVQKIPEVGRYDDLLFLYGLPDPVWTITLYVLAEALENESTSGLAAKWMPRKGRAAAILRKAFGASPKEWRKLLVQRTNVVENKMCANQFDKIDFEKVPALASARYSNAFKRHVPDSYVQFEEKLDSGEADAKADVLFPYDVLNTLRNGSESLAESQWKNLPDYVKGEKNILPVVDTSGSMLCPASGSIRAIDVSVSLGMYLAEKNNGAWQNKFISFSRTPQMHELKGNSFSERVKNMKRTDWGFNTNIEKTFDRILETAQKVNMPEKEMPSVVLIISDMQFDNAVDDVPAFEMIRNRYRDAGYEMPHLVFWNVAQRDAARPSTRSLPALADEEGVFMVGGLTPAVTKIVLSADEEQLKKLTPEYIMYQTIDQDRYRFV